MKTLAPFLAILLTSSAFAEVSGKTADGCTYRIINGKYLTDCSTKEKTASDQISEKAASPENAPQINRPVMSYDSVPVRENGNAPQSYFATSNSGASTLSIPVSRPSQGALVIDREEKLSGAILTEAPEKIRSYKFREKTYLGFGVGSASIKQSTAGSSTGLGLELGTNLDELIGVELAYSYVKQGLKLGLAQDDLSPTASDATLSSNLFAAEVHFHLTETSSRLRPFAGGGLGLKLSTLEEKNTSLYSQAYGSSQPASLSQQSIGATVTAGAKLRISRKLDLVGKFNYFAPIIRQSARLDEANDPYQESTTRLTQEDSAFTGSSQYQIVGGLHYIF